MMAVDGIYGWELFAGDTILGMGNDGSPYEIHRWEILSGDTIYRDGI